VARALQGLTFDEARHAIRRARSVRNALDAESLPALLEEKRALVNRTGMIEFLPSITGIDDIGGLGIMKQWLRDRRKLFLMRHELSAEIVPKGVLVMGISGCGKSLAIKAIASCFALPLYRIDMVEVFSGRHGKPEAAFAQACHLRIDRTWWPGSTRSRPAHPARRPKRRARPDVGFFSPGCREDARPLRGRDRQPHHLLPAEMIRRVASTGVFFVDFRSTTRARVKVPWRRRIDHAGFNLEPLKNTRGWTGAGSSSAWCRR
jgi:hypothetical protein